MDDLRYSSTSVLFLSLVRGSGANQKAAIFGVSTFQGEAYTGRIGPIVGTLESVRIIEVSAF